MNTTYFFDKQQLVDFIKNIEEDAAKPPYANYELKGYILTPGKDSNTPELHFSALYGVIASPPQEVSGDKEIIVTNINNVPKGCPYPPGY